MRAALTTTVATAGVVAAATATFLVSTGGGTIAAEPGDLTFRTNDSEQRIWGTDGPGGLTATQHIAVRGAGRGLTGLSVEVQFHVARLENLHVTVTAPDGRTSADLLRQSSASRLLEETFVFDDDAPGTVSESPGGLVRGGTFRASTIMDVPVDLDQTFDGIDPNGTWTITAAYEGEGFDGELVDSALIVTSGTQTTTSQFDTTGPAVSFTEGPSDGETLADEPTFAFASSDSDLVRYECSLDSGSYSPCSSPVVPDLGPGTHSLSVRGIDFSLNEGQPVTRSWTLRNVACEEATAAFEEVKARMRAAKERVYQARQDRDLDAVQRALTHKRQVRVDRIAAKATFREACDVGATTSTSTQ